MSALSPYLHRLEAEAMHIIRETVAEFEKPVLLYSMGKDSSVLLHLALKACYPAPLPFPLLHMDRRRPFGTISLPKILAQEIPVVPLYLAKVRPVVQRQGHLIMVDDDRLPLEPGEQPQMRSVRFRTLGCYPLTAAVQSEAGDIAPREQAGHKTATDHFVSPSNQPLQSGSHPHGT